MPHKTFQVKPARLVEGDAFGLHDPPTVHDLERIERALADGSVQATEAERLRAIRGKALCDLTQRLQPAFEQLSRSLEVVFASILDQFASIDWSRLMPGVDTAALGKLARLALRHLPPNWGEVDWRAAATFIGDTAWPIIWLPRREVVAVLLAAGPADREAMLIAHRAELLADAETALAEVNQTELCYLAGCAREVVSALRDGHDRAAQSFTGSILTGLLQGILAYETFKAARDEFGRNWEDKSIVVLRFALITSTIPSALRQFYPHNGDPVPSTYNRHALAHVPDPAQLTEINALVGLMLVVALIRELQALYDDGLLP